MFSVGVLAFIFVDVLSHATTIVSDCAQRSSTITARSGYLVWLVVLLAAGFAAGSAGLAMLERRMRPLEHAAHRSPVAPARRR